MREYKVLNSPHLTYIKIIAVLLVGGLLKEQVDQDLCITNHMTSSELKNPFFPRYYKAVIILI